MTDQQKELAAALQAVVDQCRFHVFRDTPVASAALREMYEHGIEGLVARRDYNLTVLIDDDNPALKSFVEALRVSVGDCLDDEGCIGDGLVALMGGGVWHPTVAQYARNLLRPGATLGAGTVVDMLYGWMRGDPVRYKRQFALANGVGGDPTTIVHVADGVQLSALPTSSQAIYRRFPSLNGAVDASELMGRALLTVEWISDIPGIFGPGSEAPRRGHTVAPDFHQDRFCEALSLAENKSVCWEYSWGDYGVLREFNSFGAAGYGRTMIPGRGEPIALSKQRSDEAMTICAQRASANGQRLETAIYRWLRSTEPNQAFVNRLIELRIALEALYAGSGPEVTFRQAVHGALHLGRDYEHRRHYRTLLTNAYRLASNVVHGRGGESTDENRNLLEDARDACRAGILKCLADGGDIDFDRLMFDR